ncbi:MAG: DUF1127 domain-containing protein [Gemmobacter sp.]
MAAFETVRTAHAGTQIGGRLSHFVQSLFASTAAWNDARLTRRALARLSDRELDDIGLCRGDIDEITARSLLR